MEPPLPRRRQGRACAAAPAAAAPHPCARACGCGSRPSRCASPWTHGSGQPRRPRPLSRASASCLAVSTYAPGCSRLQTPDLRPWPNLARRHAEMPASSWAARGACRDAERHPWGAEWRRPRRRRQVNPRTAPALPTAAAASPPARWRARRVWRRRWRLPRPAAAQGGRALKHAASRRRITFERAAESKHTSRKTTGTGHHNMVSSC